MSRLPLQPATQAGGDRSHHHRPVIVTTVSQSSPPPSFLAVDPAKVQRARDRVLDEATDRDEKRSLEEGISCIMFDARLDQTKVRYFDKEQTKKYSPA